MTTSEPLPLLYRELSDWWTVLSAPADYAEEAEVFRRTLLAASPDAHTLLELGSGGGNNASHLKRHFQITLVDLAPGMLEQSRKLNPECEHFEGDMRTVRLRRIFDAVFIHDAIDYMLSEADLRAAIETAFIHCKPGGVALFVPDHTCETFKESTNHGGEDAGQRSLRYLEWTWDSDPSDTTYHYDFVYMLREGEEMRTMLDRHTCGLFAQRDWLRLMQEAGFEAQMLPYEHSEFEPGSAHLFLGRRPL